MEGFTKEVLMMWKVLAVEGGRCIAPRAGKKGIKRPIWSKICFKICDLVLTIDRWMLSLSFHYTAV